MSWNYPRRLHPDQAAVQSVQSGLSVFPMDRIQLLPERHRKTKEESTIPLYVFPACEPPMKKGFFESFYIWASRLRERGTMRERRIYSSSGRGPASMPRVLT